MYDELVKSIHCCFGFKEPAVTDCENCMMKDKREEYNYEGCCDALGLAAADAIEVLSKMETTTPRWIPVEERLPEDLQTVLVIRKDGGIFCWMYSACSPTDEVWVDEYANAFSVYDTAYWMPLPEPPKEE